MKDRLEIRINGKRLVDRLERLAEIGRREDGSCQRLALTDEDKQGRDLIVSWMHELGLEVRVDRIGNIFGIRKGRDDIPAIMTGSHIDTVAAGGKYDGCYGVVAGLEIADRLNEEGVVTRRPFVVAAFTDEEGVRFQPDMLGSLVYAGGMDLEKALAVRSPDGFAVGEELKRIGYAGTLEPGKSSPMHSLNFISSKARYSIVSENRWGRWATCRESLGKRSKSEVFRIMQAQRRWECARTPDTAHFVSAALYATWHLK